MRYLPLIFVLVCSGCVSGVPAETVKQDAMELDISQEYLELLVYRLDELKELDELGDVDKILESVSQIKLMLEDCPERLLSIPGFDDKLTMLYRELDSFELNVIVDIGDAVIGEAHK